MAGGKHKEYDDDLLVQLIARGDISLRRIGERVGLSTSMVCRIAAGQNRPELQQRIQAIVQESRNRAQRLGAMSLVNLVAKHIAEGLNKDTDPSHARRCREFAINKFLDSPEPTTPSQDQDQKTLPTPGLTSEDYKLIAKLKGGPQDDTDDQAANQE